MYFPNKRRVFAGLSNVIINRIVAMGPRPVKSTASSESGFLYADAMGVALVASLMLPVLLLLMSTLVLQWKDAERTRDTLQTAVMVMEKNKYNIKHHKAIVTYADALAPGCYVTSYSQDVSVDGATMPQLVVTAYDGTNGDKVLMQFETYVWTGEQEATP